MPSPSPSPTSEPALVRSPSSVIGTAGSPVGFWSKVSGLWSFLACLCLLWFILINQLRGAWSADPQYSYGFVVPVLMLGLLLRRYSDLSSLCLLRGETPLTPRWLFMCAFIALSVLVLPTRLILESSPDWRLMNWLLAVEVVFLTLMLIRLVGPQRFSISAFQHFSFSPWPFAFPIAFILVAVPWPFSIERPLIQGLTQTNAKFVIEILLAMGIPAVQHGNLIEVGTGTVGIDEACSGIRSFQSSLMISLFFGEFYRLGLWRRLVLVPLGFFVSFLFNICRTTILTWIAAKDGPGAIAKYHDQAGLTILLCCSAVLWFIAYLLHRHELRSLRAAELSAPISHLQAPSSPPPAPPAFQDLSVSGFPSAGSPGPISASQNLSDSGFERVSESQHFRISAFQASTALLLWLLAVEASVEAWYRSHEALLPPVPTWTISWPPPVPGFSDQAIPQRTREILGYDEGHSGTWKDTSGAAWQMYYFRWNPGKQQSWLSGIHRPDVCMASMGHTLRDREDRRLHIQVGSLELPFKIYTYGDARLHVFHCFWEQRSAGKEFKPVEPDRSQRLRAVLTGQRNLGQQTLQIAVRGIQDESEATKALAGQLQHVLRVASPQ